MDINIDELRDSNEFLNILFKNIDTAVFIVDGQFKIHQFNNSFINLFSSSKTDLLDTTFGPASGCVNAVNEGRPCGETSACKECVLKRSLIKTLTKTPPKNKEYLERIFYINGVPQKKYFEFTSRPITYQNKKMILVFVYDVTAIETSKFKLEKKQRQIDIDLEKAGEIQKSLLPHKLPDLSSIDIGWYFEPSLSIGGDIFHVYQENENLISAYMLDVSGHGVSAALIAVTAKQFLDQLHCQGLRIGTPYSPKEILIALQNEFPFERFDSYFTIVNILLNIGTGEMIYGCAGHVPPLVIHPSGDFKKLDHGGSIIGLKQESSMDEYHYQLKPSDKLILYTDGLVDYFGKRGRATININFHNTIKVLRNESVDNIVDGIVIRHKQMRNNPDADDDISLLVIEYLGSES